MGTAEIIEWNKHTNEAMICMKLKRRQSLQSKKALTQPIKTFHDTQIILEIPEIILIMLINIKKYGTCLIILIFYMFVCVCKIRYEL